MLIAGAGYILGKTFTVDSRTIGRMVFYIFSPLRWYYTERKKSL